MASVAPDPLAAGGAARSLQPLPIDELKSLFINFLEQHGYAVPQEANIILDDAVHCLSGSGRGPSPCPSVASNGKRSLSVISSDELSGHSDVTVKGSDEDDGPFQTVIAKRKTRKVARRQRKISTTQATVTATGKVTVGVNSFKKAGVKPSPPPKSKAPPPMYLRDKSKWSLIAAECTRLHINFTKAQKTKSGIKISVASIEDFRNLNRYLIQNNLPFHTFALE
ncbi:hypothetical protein EVAR_69051_1 [Eumeta japonica]|uniref:Uncharacterized protein n=1 Tax=Eumeta variegata TaxID=151549 RepID=A0A4C1ZCM0_EUMVA|nr:hypothetical protein EVAR_69051_1 [Eumeta japonica]